MVVKPFMSLTRTSPFSQTLTNPTDRRSFHRLQWMRAAVVTTLLLFVHQVVHFGGLFAFVLLSSLGGIVAAGLLLQRGVRFTHAALIHGAVLLVGWLALGTANIVLTGQSSSEPSRDFLIAQLGDELSLIAIFYLSSLVLTYYFWCRRSATTLEAIVLTSFVVWMLSGHRNYHLDAPKQISSLTWKLGLLQKYHIEPQHLFIGLGVMFALVLGLYLAAASERPLFFRPREVRDFGAKRYFLSGATVLLLLSALVTYALFVNERYTADLSRATEGVGQNNKEGQSNLGFHSAIGETRQPSALVRLEGDYQSNPWSPMLYLREGALSDFNGRELVIATNAYDTDVPRVAPGQPYIAGLPPSEMPREKIVHSVYLLAKHNSVFAIDYPTRISLIKNPDPERFSLAYQAVSEAPTVKIDDLVGKAVGSPQWDQATWQHYLRAPGSLTPLIDQLELNLQGEPALDAHGEDMRYRVLASQLTNGIDDPVERAVTVVRYLSEQSIYTRSPGHQISPQGDPVAPYLFAEKKRGYCVHFAHAAVYMLRLLGIPSRIATGYLTDLQYAKDGHILLNMGDRHAWPEVFIDGYGWVVFDVTPAQAENEQALIPDEKLLDELMNKLDPAQELVTPPEDTKEEPDQQQIQGVIERVLDARVLIPLVLTILLLWTTLKLWLRFGYLMVPGGPTRVRLAYLSFSSAMTDLGYARRYGETRREWAHRLKRTTGVDGHDITVRNEQRAYGRAPSTAERGDLRKTLASTFRGLNTRLPIIRRFIAFFSPRSVFRRWSQ